MLFLFSFGGFFLFFPDRVQRFALKRYEKRHAWRMFRGYVESKGYLWGTRFVGVCAWLMATLLAWGLFSALKA